MCRSITDWNSFQFQEGWLGRSYRIMWKLPFQFQPQLQNAQIIFFLTSVPLERIHDEPYREYRKKSNFRKLSGLNIWAKCMVHSLNVLFICGHRTDRFTIFYGSHTTVLFEYVIFGCRYFNKASQNMKTSIYHTYLHYYTVVLKITEIRPLWHIATYTYNRFIQVL